MTDEADHMIEIAAGVSMNGSSEPAVVAEEPIPNTNGAFVLDEVVRAMRRYVVFPSDDAAHAVALFVAHTYAVEAADTAVYLYIGSPEKMSGKSRLLEVLEHLVANPMLAANASTAVLFRNIAPKDRPRATVMLDEVDTIFTGKGSDNEDLRGLLNAGIRRGAKFARMGGANRDQVHEFEVFGPKVLSGISDYIPETIESRCVPISMLRATPEEMQRTKKFRYRTAEQSLAEPRQLLIGWISEVIDDLDGAVPDNVPDELTDRMAEAWEPLLAIADAAGEKWPSYARQAARTLRFGSETEAGSNAGSLPLQLLRDVLRVTAEMEVDVPTAELIDRLHGLPDAPWRSLDETGIDAQALSRMLRRYHGPSKKIRRGDKTMNGWILEPLRQCGERYLGESVADPGPES